MRSTHMASHIASSGFVAAVLLAGVLVVAGCDTTSMADPPPGPPTATRGLPSHAPSPSMSPASSPSAAPFDATSPPEPPAGLDGPPSEEAAAAAATYFLSLFPYMFASGDVAAWDEMRGDSCEYCAGIREIADEYLRDGKRSVGGQIVVSNAQGFHEAGDSYVVAVRLTQKPSHDVDSTGAVIDQNRSTVEASAEMRVVWASDRWRVDGVDMTVLREN